jgi:hypothetical protein
MGKDRFKIKDTEGLGLFTSTRIIVDTETGVNYLLASYGNGCGLTPLLDAEGKPIISEIESGPKDGYQK